MRHRATILLTGTALFSLSAARAFADILPSFPDPEAPETKPLLAVALLFAAIVSGTSFWLLRRIGRARRIEREDVTKAIATPTDDVSDDSRVDGES